MTSDENATHKPEDQTEEAKAPDAEAADAPENGGNGDTLEDIIARLEAENAELRDKMLRAVAEMENLRRRSERELGDTRSYAIAGFARDMLVATDNLSRALMVVPAEARDNADGTLKSLIEGIEMTEREMQRLLQKHGVTPIEAQGEKFDPHRHQAMFEVPDTETPEGTVVQVVQSGYAIGGRVLRPAMVGVAKGGPKQAPVSDPDDSGESASSGQPDAPNADGIDKNA